MQDGFEFTMFYSSRRLNIAGFALVWTHTRLQKSPCSAMHGMSCSDCSSPILSPDDYSSLDGSP